MEERYYKYLLQNAAYNMILNKKNQSIYWNEYSVDDDNDDDDDDDDGGSLNRSINNENQYYWLDELRNIICPRIMNQYHNNLFYINRNFDNYSSDDVSSDVNSSKYHINDTNSVSYNHMTTTTTATTTVVNHTYISMYSKVLHLLQAADASGLWPTTTVARSKVIQSADSSSGMVSYSSYFYYR
jgi:hypothetical protein